MKRSKAGIVFVIIGLVLVLIAPVWKWGIAPSAVKIPDAINQTLIYEGLLTLNVDPTSMSPLAPGGEYKIPLTITRIDVSDKAKGTNKVAVIKEPVVVRAPGRDLSSYTKYYALDRKTGKNVSDHNSDTNRTDYSLLLGFFVDKNKSYAIWDDDVGLAGPLEYVSTEKMDGFKYKNVEVLEWKAGGGGAEKTKSPPSGFPSKISGAQMKAVLKNPNLPFSDTEMLKIPYLKATTATLRADQKTGSLFDVVDNKEEYFVDATALGMGKLKMATIQYHQTPENIKQNLDVAAKNYMLLNSVEIYMPLIMLILGVIALVIGLALIIRKKAS